MRRRAPDDLAAASAIAKCFAWIPAFAGMTRVERQTKDVDGWDKPAMTAAAIYPALSALSPTG